MCLRLHTRIDRLHLGILDKPSLDVATHGSLACATTSFTAAMTLAVSTALAMTSGETDGARTAGEGALARAVATMACSCELVRVKGSLPPAPALPPLQPDPLAPWATSAKKQTLYQHSEVVAVM
jgi:hypothetical protein